MARTAHPDHRSRDAGMTLTELVVSIGVLGLLSIVVAGAVTVVFRSEQGIGTTVAESHDVQQAVNYFHLDVQAGPSDPAAYRGSSAPDGGTGCSDAGDDNVFRYDDGSRRVAYRLTVGDHGALDRYECELIGASWTEVRVINIADSLVTDGGPTVEVDVIDSTGDDEVDQVVMAMAQRHDDRVVAASPRAETGVAGASTGTCTDDPLTAALDFAAFVRNDVTLLGQNVLGTLAVGGKLAWTPALGVSQNDKNQSYGGVALYAAEVDWSFPGSGTLNVNGGDVALGGAYHAFTSGSWKGRVYATDAGTGKFVDAKKSVVSVASVGQIDFDARFAELEACSNLLAELPGSCSAADCAYHVQPLATDSGCTASAPYTGSGKMCLDLGSKGAQILNIPESELADITEFSHKGGLSQAHPLIITVIDDDDDQHIDFTLTTSSWQNIGNTKNVLVNFPTARTVTIDQPLFGTVLAPYAEVTTIGNVQGGVVAASWIHRSGTVNNEGNNVFDGTIDWE